MRRHRAATPGPEKDLDTPEVWRKAEATGSSGAAPAPEKSKQSTPWYCWRRSGRGWPAGPEMHRGNERDGGGWACGDGACLQRLMVGMVSFTASGSACSWTSRTWCCEDSRQSAVSWSRAADQSPRAAMWNRKLCDGAWRLCTGLGMAKNGCHCQREMAGHCSQTNWPGRRAGRCRGCGSSRTTWERPSEATMRPGTMPDCREERGTMASGQSERRELKPPAVSRRGGVLGQKVVRREITLQRPYLASSGRRARPGTSQLVRRGRPT